MSDTDALPINTVLPELRSALERPGAVVLAARPLVRERLPWCRCCCSTSTGSRGGS
ncbi:MAG: hypothetical protein AB2812_07970 [Candidatus Sedimenticola endophacoides]